MKKILLVVALVIAALFGYQKYQQQQAEEQELATINKAMLDGSVRVAMQLKLMSGEHAVSYGEFQKAAAENNSAIAQSIVALKNKLTPRHPDNIKHAVVYLEQAQGVIRAAKRTTDLIIELKSANREAAGARSKLTADLDRVQTFLDNPGSKMPPLASNYIDTKSISRRQELAALELESTALELKERIADLLKAKPPEKSGLSANVYLSRQDFPDITVEVK